MILDKLIKAQVISPPGFLETNTIYLTMMGSVAYGVADEDKSDIDIYGCCIPPKTIVFPHLAGHIEGFGKQRQRFDQYQEHGINYDKKVYDLSVYNIVKYFQLCMENNPNMIDSLFTPLFCVMHISAAGQVIRDNAKLFLHKGSWHKFKGYAYSQMAKIKSKNPEGKRKELIETHGYDIKFAYHLVRLLNEVEQILIEGDLDLLRNREQLKSIRRGEWSEDDIYNYFISKEKELETVYINSKLPDRPNEDEIKLLLLKCLKMHYGSLDNTIVIPGEYDQALREIKQIVERFAL